MPLPLGSRGQVPFTNQSMHFSSRFGTGKPLMSAGSSCASRTSMKSMPRSSQTERTIELLPSPGHPRTRIGGSVCEIEGSSKSASSCRLSTFLSSSADTMLCVSNIGLLVAILFTFLIQVYNITCAIYVNSVYLDISSNMIWIRKAFIADFAFVSLVCN